jgi:hypothetical protein
MLLLAFVGCDVHEFPEDYGVRVPFLLHLDFNTEMPLYKEILYTRGGETREITEPHDIRYIINAYRTDNKRSDNRVADTTFIFSKSDISDLNYTAQLQLPEGTYDFSVWADYIDAGSTDDKYYDTRDFSEIILADKENHSGSNDFRDAFRGYASATVTNPDYYTGLILDSINNQATAEMKRPMGKFKFVATDVELFLLKVAQRLSEKGINVMPIGDNLSSQAVYEHLLQRIDLDGFKIVFRYNMFMPCSFNMFTDRPADSWTGVSFISQMHLEKDKEMLLGYDYIFVNGSETTLSVSLEVYTRDGELISSTNPINVPIVRSKLTVVKGEFLSLEASGGVTINPGYEGDDYNIEIY